MPPSYDYTSLPLFTEKAKWFIGEDHWIEIEIHSSGIIYYGTDYSCISGGGYTAGFQSFDEFLSNGPIKGMPDAINQSLRKHLLRHRKTGGASFLFTHRTKLTDHVLWRAFVHLDGLNIRFYDYRSMEQNKEIVFFRGAIPFGEHTIGFVLIFKKKEALKEEDPLWKVNAKYSIKIDKEHSGTRRVQLYTFQDEKSKKITTRFIDEAGYDNQPL